MTWRHWVTLVWIVVVLALAGWALLTSPPRKAPHEPTSRVMKARTTPGAGTGSGSVARGVPCS